MCSKEILYPNCDCGIWLRSCREEIVDKIKGKISGEVPGWLAGTLVRNGPGLLRVGDDQFDHLFDGLSLLHRFEVANGDVTYQCRFLESDVYKRNITANRIVMTEFGTKSVVDPCNNIFNRISSIFHPERMISDNNMISVYPFSDELYVFGEGPILHRINSKTLTVENTVDMHERVGVINHTSHPHVEEDGTVYNLGLSVSKTGPVHNIVCFPKHVNSEKMFDEARIVASIPSRWRLNPSYMHTFGMTQNYFIIVEQPLSLSVVSLVKCRIKNKPLIGALHWNKGENTQINVICRKTGNRTHIFEANAFFFLHIINQYEKDNYLVLDICCYKDPSMIECMYIESMKNMHHNPDYAKMFRGRPLRFMLPLDIAEGTKNLAFPSSSAKASVLKDGTVFLYPEKLCDLGCETPRINYHPFLGKEYRYFYAISSDVDSFNPGTLIKVDTKTKTCITWCEPNCYPSEPIFVPNQPSWDEDDGLLLCSMVWGGDDENRVGLLILDAENLREIGRAEFTTRTPVPKCLHGWFQPQKNL